MTDTSDRITMLKTQTDELRAATEQLRRWLPEYVELAAEVARTRKALYDAHVEAGFDENQALTMCQKLTL